MSTSEAAAFLHRLESDQDFVAYMQPAGGEAETMHRLAAEAGYAFTEEEVLEALDAVYGVEQAIEQLERVAAGDIGRITLSVSVTGPAAGSTMIAAALG